jgi:uncharacterized protein (DUF3820 family)
MIIYPYRDATEALQEIVNENKPASASEKRRLADACEDYLDWLDGYDGDEDEE